MRDTRRSRESDTARPDFSRTARFPSSQAALLIYGQIEEVLFAAAESDLSAYNLQLDGVPHVVVLGESPPAALREQIEELLEMGDPTSLPDEVLRALNRRRLRQITRGAWVEEHHRPGKRLNA